MTNRSRLNMERLAKRSRQERVEEDGPVPMNRAERRAFARGKLIRRTPDGQKAGGERVRIARRKFADMIRDQAEAEGKTE